MAELETGARRGADAAAATGFGSTAGDMVGDDADANAPVNAMEDMGGLPTLPDMYCGLSND